MTTPPTAGNLTRVESKSDASTSVSTYYTYDSYGNVLTEIDANGNVWTTTYESTYHTFPATISAPITGQTESYAFDARTGNLLSRTDVNGQTTSYEYDLFGRLTKVIRPGDSFASPTTKYEYNHWGTLGQQHLKSLAKVAEGDYLWSSQYFDGLGRVIQTQSRGETGNTIIISATTEYNGRGLVSREYVAQSGSPVGISYHEYTCQAVSDGLIRSYDGTNYLAAQSASTGDVVYYNFREAWSSNSKIGGGIYAVDRAFFRFDTSSLPDNCTVVAAKLFLYVEKFSSLDSDGGMASSMRALRAIALSHRISRPLGEHC